MALYLQGLATDRDVLREPDPAGPRRREGQSQGRALEKTRLLKPPAAPRPPPGRRRRCAPPTTNGRRAGHSLLIQSDTINEARRTPRDVTGVPNGIGTF